MTLIELVVTASLTLLVLVLATRFFWPLVRTVIRCQERAGLQQRATLAMDSLKTALQCTNAGGLSYRPGQLILHPIDPRGKPRYLVELWGFTLADGQLRRQRWQPAAVSDDVATRLTPAQMAALPPAPERLLAGGVTEFSVTETAPVSNPLRVRLVVANHDDRFLCEETVLLRNSL